MSGLKYTIRDTLNVAQFARKVHSPVSHVCHSNHLTHDSNPLFPFMMHISIVLDYQSISPTNTFAKTHGTALSQSNSNIYNAQEVGRV
jgi:hypothetical protein